MYQDLKAKELTKLVLKKSKKEFIIKFITSICVRGMIMIIPILFSYAVDAISTKNYDRAYLIIGLSVLTVIFYRIMDILNTYCWHKLYNKMYEEYTKSGVSNTYGNSIFSLSRINLSEYINIMNTDIDVICAFYCDLLVRIVRLFEFLIIFVYFFLINFYMGVISVIVSLVAFVIMLLSSKKIEYLNKMRASDYDKKTSILQEFFLCIKEIKAFNIVGSINSRTKENTNKYLNSLLKQRVVEDSYKFGIVLMIELFRLVLFIYGVYLISNGNMELGVLLVIYNYYSQLIDNFSDFATVNSSFRKIKVSEGRIDRLLKYSKGILKDDKGCSTEVRGEIIFDNVLYGYKDNPMLNHASFKIEAGKLTCIIDKSGSGKTGVFDLLLKLNRQHEGDILIDEIDINDYTSDDYYRLVASSNKNPVFFNVSIKENLMMMGANFRRVISICKELGIHDYIIQLKKGYDTILNDSDDIDPNVKNLLGIARVLLKNSKIMLFDETFNSLNMNVDNRVIDILEQMKSDHTIVIITREQHILRHADNIIMIDNRKAITVGDYSNIKNF